SCPRRPKFGGVRWHLTQKERFDTLYDPSYGRQGRQLSVLNSFASDGAALDHVCAGGAPTERDNLHAVRIGRETPDQPAESKLTQTEVEGAQDRCLIAGLV